MLNNQNNFNVKGAKHTKGLLHYLVQNMRYIYLKKTHTQKLFKFTSTKFRPLQSDLIPH